MKKMKRDIVVIGGGPAGLSAAISAYKNGCNDVLVIEREKVLGGILNQCIHDGFGLHHFKKTLTGPEYAQRYIDEFARLNIESMLGTIVLSLKKDRSLIVSSIKGIAQINAKAIILAMGCRERTAASILLPGTRPAGIYTAGAAQNMINLQNIMVGRQVVILGSGDIGMIMARRMTLEGAKVVSVYELLPYASGLQRNIQQCLNDYNIPLKLGTTVTEIHGKNRIRGVTVTNVDERRSPIPGSELQVSCDTLLLSVGLIPENELTREAGITLSPETNGPVVDDTLMTNIPGIFSCGNVLHVHDLVDYVSEEAERAGEYAARYVKKELPSQKDYIKVIPANGIGYVMPQKVSGLQNITLSFRVSQPCNNKYVSVRSDGYKVIRKKKIRLHPAEMVRIEINAAKLNGAKVIEVEIE